MTHANAHSYDDLFMQMTTTTKTIGTTDYAQVNSIEHFYVNKVGVKQIDKFTCDNKLLSDFILLFSVAYFSYLLFLNSYIFV